MTIFNRLLGKVKAVYSLYSSEVSLAVEDIAARLHFCPQQFELAKEGRAMMIRPVNSRLKGGTKIRLERCGISLCMAAQNHVALNYREAKILNIAVHRWLS